MLDLTQYNTNELSQLIAEIDRELASRRREELRKARQEIRATAEKYGVTVAELVGNLSKPASQPRAAKYRHPDDHSKTWSGRGRRPAWVTEWLDAGRSLEELEIEQ